MSAIGPAQPVVSDAPRIKGRIERVEAGVAIGWVFDPVQPNTAIDIEIRIGAETVGRGSADQFSTALQNAGFGDGQHGFRLPLSIPYQDGRAVALRLHDASTGDVIASRPYTVHCLNPEWIEPRELGTRTVQGVTKAAANDATLKKPLALRDWSAPARKRGKRLWKRVRARTPLRGSSRPISTPDLNPIENAWLVDPVVETGTGLIGATEQVGHWPRLRLPKVERPEVSVIIPVHNQFHLTYQCLLSIVLANDTTSFEVIVVDDQSSDATQQVQTVVENLRVVRNETNLGFLHSCNKAANAAKGEYLLFLNNDTEVHSDWLDAMCGVFNRFDRVGAVGAKLVYSDGRLQDAGGIVWNTGVPWNVGNGRDAEDPKYNYVRDVDYLTGAALMVARGAWDAANGFSENYAPAYYEDTDLAFKLRERGYRTLYCPQAVVTHFEGGSHGTDLESGGKRYQSVNAREFVNTWTEQFTNLGDEGRDLHLQKDRNIGFRVLMVDHAFPRLGEDAGSYAAMQEIALLQTLGAKVTFLPQNLLYLGNHVDMLQAKGVECAYSPYIASVEQFIAERGAEFDLLYVTRYTVAENIIPLARRAGINRVIFNNADLHFLRELRQAIVAGEPDRTSIRRTRQRELAVMQSADVVLTYSETERQIIASHLMHDDHVYLCPWVLPDRSVDETPLSQRCGICFVGGFAHPPNREGMDWFVAKVWPELVAAKPDIALEIWGSHMPNNTEWDRQPGIRLRGYAESLDEVFGTSRLFIAPLLSGAGVKGKVLDSVSYRVPSILSPIAAEATGLVDGIDTFIASTPDEWVEHTLRLLQDDELWLRTQAALSDVKQKQYSLEVGRSRMRSALVAAGIEA